MSNKAKYPECEKIAKLRDKSQAIGEFLDWLQESKEIVLARYQGKLDTLTEARESTESLLADYFDIDLKKAEEERQQMIEEIRKEPTP